MSATIISQKYEAKLIVLYLSDGFHYNFFQESDVKSTLTLLKRCAPFYQSGELTGECLTYPRPCIRVPPECITHNAVYTILHFLTDDKFLGPESVRNLDLQPYK